MSSSVNTADHVKCISLRNQQCMAQPTLINLHPNEYIEGLHCYPFAVNLDRCMGSCNTLSDLSNETENLSLSIFNMITRINQSKILIKHMQMKM